MKRFLCVFFAFVFLSGPVLPAALAYNGDVLVYITNTGECYHRDGCSYLKSRIEITLQEAVDRGYRACSRCHPPKLNMDSETDSDPYHHTHQQTGTSGSSSGSSGSSASTPPTTTSASSETVTRENKPSTAAMIFAVLLLVYAGGSIVFTIIYLPCAGIAEIAKHRKEKAVQEQQKTERIARYREQYAELETMTRNEIARKCGMPENIEIGVDGFPHGTGENDPYVFYITNSGACFHAKRNCAQYAHPVHAVSVRGARPCKRCKPVAPDMKWYREYKKVLREMRDAGMTVRD